MPAVKTLWNQRVLMRDGIEIAVDIMLPATAGEFPCVLLRTPYERGRHATKPGGWLRLLDYGYALITADVRGRNDSDGEWTVWNKDGDDAYDIIEWIAAQTWSTGKVGTVGGSYLALTQWWAAAAKPPHLTCMAPLCVGATHSAIGFGGVPVQYWIWWLGYTLGKTVQNPAAFSWENDYYHLPLRELDKQYGISRSFWAQYANGEIEFTQADASLSAEDFADIDIPVLVGVGWWDDQATMDTWMALQNAKSADQCRLLIGAWDHVGNMAPRHILGGMDVSNSVIDTVAYIEQFLAIHLKDQVNDLSASPRCRIFDAGLSQWQSVPMWPATNTTAKRFFLGSHDHARGLKGNGFLGDQHASPVSSDSYIYDPNQAARDMANLDQFGWSDPPLDHRYLHRRDDLLIYNTPPLAEPMTISGRVVLHAFISSDRHDTDMFVGIYDIHPDGRAIALFATNEPRGGLRLRYRNGAVPELLEPHTIVEVEVMGPWFHHTIASGHQLRISISSNDFPFAVRNAGTGEHWADDTVLLPQENTLHYGKGCASYVVIPVVEGEVA